MENTLINRISPKKNRILILPKNRSDVTKSGIILPEAESNATPVIGTIVKAGPLSTYEVGQTVMWRRFSIDELKVEVETGEEVIFYFVEDEEVIAVIEDEPN